MFDKPVVVKYIYIKPSDIFENSHIYRQTRFSIAGYNKNVLQFDQRDVFGISQVNYWVK